MEWGSTESRGSTEREEHREWRTIGRRGSMGSRGNMKSGENRERGTIKIRGQGVEEHRE